MTLDHWLVARLARDLDVLLRGTRVELLTSTFDGLLCLCYRRPGFVALHALVDSDTPLVCGYETAKPQKHHDQKSWLGDVSGLLRGARIDRVWALPRDRVLNVDVASRSAFGLPSPSRITIELQPRKANAFVLRVSNEDGRWIIVAAAKQFPGNSVRPLAVGIPYQPPPARVPTLDRAQFIIASSSLDQADRQGWERLLTAHDVDCTPPLAREVVHRVFGSGAAPKPAHACLREWSELREQVAAASETGPITAWCEGGRLACCHLIPLSWPPGVTASFASMNELCVELLRARDSAAPTDNGRLRERVRDVLARYKREIETLEAALETARSADALRAAGEAIYANLPTIAPRASTFTPQGGAPIALDPGKTPQANAAQYFRRYKKARNAVAPVGRRLETLAGQRDYWEHLLWELEREELDAHARMHVLDEVREALETVASRGRRRRAHQGRAKPRPPLRVELSGGACAYVGRSPRENERLTFVAAAPTDYWFHARGVPGAHVIVKGGAAQLGADQIQAAARLAALHSRASRATKVDVDYTHRRHVRRRGGPGLVWYKNFRTIQVDLGG